MRIEKKVEAQDNQDQVQDAELQNEEVQADKPISTPDVDEAARKLELENAELKGKVSAFQEISKNVPRETSQANPDQWKINAIQDSNSLNDEEFFNKYKHTKLQAAQAIHEYEIKNLSESQSRKFAKIEAENKLLSKYPDLYEHDASIQEAINDASPEVRSDPDRLAKAIERAYLANQKGSAKPKGEPMERKQISSGFEKPLPRSGGVSRKEESDAIPEEYAYICKKMGITSEKERQKWMKSDDIETHFGDGIVLRDREKGFEKVA